MTNSLKHYLLNFAGSLTNRKTVIFQSDDWGSIRMPSEKLRLKLNNHSLIDARDAYCKYDTLETAEDLEALYEVLTSVKDQTGNYAVLTANCVMANPDFNKIRESGFIKYSHESLESTFERHCQEEALSMWYQGLSDGVFFPQFHGREHVNVPFWMRALRQGHKGVKYAFDQGVFGVNFEGLGLRKKNFQAAWDYENHDQEKVVSQSIIEGMSLFERRFGFSSKTVIAPSYTWSDDQADLLESLGNKKMQGILNQKIPVGIEQNYKLRNYLFSKKRNSLQLRNVFFEPSLTSSNQVVEEALKRIDIAFKMKKPAIISTHRLNFIGSLNSANRERNLRDLKILLTEIIKKWPDVEFRNASEIITD